MSREAFEQFWSAYPKRPNNPKHPAWQVWERLAKSNTLPSLPDLLRAVQGYADLMKELKIEPKFIAHTRTWLNQRRWEEFLEEKAPEPVQQDIIPPALKPLVDAIGVGWWQTRKRDWNADAVSEEGDKIVIRTPDRYRMQQIELDAGMVARITGRDVELRYSPPN